MKKIQIIGNLAADAEIKFLESGTSVCNFPVYVNTTDRNKEKITDKFRCALWGKRGEALAEHLSSGKQVFIEGKLSFQTFRNKNNENVTSNEISVNDIVLLGGGKKEPF